MDDFDMLDTAQPAVGNGVGLEEDPAAAFLAQQESEIAGIESDEGFSILDGGAVPSLLSEPDAVDGVINGDFHEVKGKNLPPAEKFKYLGVLFANDGKRDCEIDHRFGVTAAVMRSPYRTAAVKRELSYKESNGPSDAYAAVAQVDRLRAEPESLRKWREEQKERLEVLDANSRQQEVEWKEKAKQELEEWHARQDEQLEKTKVNNRVLDEDFYKQPFSELIGYVAAEEALLSDVDENNPGTEWERVARLCDFNPKSSKQAKDVSRMRSVLISLKQTPLVR